MGEAGDRILRSLEQAVSIARGEMAEGEYVVHVPEHVDVKAIRTRLNMTQADFARTFGLKLATVRHWEQEQRMPEGPARAYLLLIDRVPDIVRKTLHAG